MQSQSFLSFISSYQTQLKNTREQALTLQPRYKSQQNISENQIVRKSRRLQQKQKRRGRKQRDQYYKRRQFKSSRKTSIEVQYQKSMFQRLQDANLHTIKQANVMYKNNTFYYSIEVKNNQRCSKHSQSQKRIKFSIQQINNCPYCIKVGTYWFTQSQLRKFNAGTYFRRFIQTRLQ